MGAQPLSCAVRHRDCCTNWWQADEPRWRNEQRDVVVDEITRYNPDAVICVGIPFGHTRPQWILPHGGEITVDRVHQRIFADYAQTPGEK